MGYVLQMLKLRHKEIAELANGEKAPESCMMLCSFPDEGDQQLPYFGRDRPSECLGVPGEPAGSSVMALWCAGPVSYDSFSPSLATSVASF